jgi:protein-disulfide isomerase
MSSTPGTDPDLTRKQRREQARVERKALEAQHAQAARRRRLLQLGGVVAVVVVVIAIILISSGGSSNSGGGGLASGKKSSQTVAAVTAVVGGIPQSGNTLGNPHAPVTIQYFGDLECPICREFTLGALPTVIDKYVRTGKVKLEYHSLETATREPATFRSQQIAAYAAGKQNRAWYYIELFYHEQGREDSGYATEGYLQGLAQQVPGLNLISWSAARNDPALAEEVSQDAQAANLQGFTGTPSFLIGKTGGTLSKFEPASLTEASAFESTINQLLKS